MDANNRVEMTPFLPGSNSIVRLVSAMGYHSDHPRHKICRCRNLASPAPSRRSHTRNIRRHQKLGLRKGIGQNFVRRYNLIIPTRLISMRVAAKRLHSEESAIRLFD